MKKFILFQLFCIFTAFLYGQEVKSYNMDVNINVDQKKVDVKGTLLIDFENQNSINLYLWRNTTMNKVISEKKNVSFTFDTLIALPLPFIANAGKLVVQNPEGRRESQQIQFEYSCDMRRNMTGFGKTFTDEWIEMGYYAAWYPVHEESRKFISEITISINNDYKINGSGMVTRKDNYWQMKQPWEAFDILIVASKDLKTKKMEQRNISVETVYATFPDTDIDSLITTFSDVLEFFTERFGGQSSEVYLKFIIDPTDGMGAYGRKNLIRIKASKFNNYFKNGMAHELSHSWWQKADMKTWEDWLNESFAEYSMLLYMREKIGRKLYNETIETYKKRAENMPPIWGIERSSKEAYTTLYEKGSLLLIALEQKLGKEQMSNFLRLIIDKSINNTVDYLKILEEFSSKEIKDWFTSQLIK